MHLKSFGVPYLLAKTKSSNYKLTIQLHLFATSLISTHVPGLNPPEGDVAQNNIYFSQTAMQSVNVAVLVAGVAAQKLHLPAALLVQQTHQPSPKPLANPLTAADAPTSTQHNAKPLS